MAEKKTPKHQAEPDEEMVVHQHQHAHPHPQDGSSDPESEPETALGDKLAPRRIIIIGAAVLTGLIVLIAAGLLIRQGESPFVDDQNSINGEVEAAVGETVTVAGVEMQIAEAVFRNENSELMLLAGVRLKNNGSGTIEYGAANFSAELTGDDAFTVSFAVPTRPLESGSLEPGQEVTGNLLIQIPPEHRDNTVLVWEPDFASRRVIIRL